MGSSTISYLWRDTNAPQGFRSGVSLHSHTNQSSETLAFLAKFGKQFSGNPTADGADGASVGGESRVTGELCGQLLDAADDPQAGLRPGEPAD